MNTMLTYAPLLIQGSLVTFAALLVAGTISIMLGILLGILSCRSVGSTPLIWCIKAYTFITKGVPAYVQILIAYFVIPSLLNITIPGFLAATIALGICSSGYTAEIIRAQINAVPKGQWDACFVLGYSAVIRLRRIIVPQVIKTALPALIGELDQLLKSTSLLAAIGVTELARAGMNIVSRELNPFPVYCTIALIYLLFSALLGALILYTERKERYDYRQ